MEANADHEEENLVNYAHCLFSLKRVSHRTSFRVYKSHLVLVLSQIKAKPLWTTATKKKEKKMHWWKVTNITAPCLSFVETFAQVCASFHWLWHHDKGSLLPTRGRMPRRVSDLLWAHCWTDFLFLDFLDFWLPCSARPNASLFKTISQS